MAACFLFEIEVYDPVEEDYRTIRVTSANGYNHPSAPGPYRDALKNQSRFRREISLNGNVFGPSTVDYGRVIVVNLDGWLDWIQENDCAVDDGFARILFGDDKANYSTFVPIFTGRVDQVIASEEAQEFRFRDEFSAIISKTIQKKRFLGNNSLPDGVEGGLELIDQWKSVLYGYAGNFPLILVNSSKLIYFVCDAAVEDITIDSVDDRGVSLTAGTERASIADLEANTPSAGTYDYFLGSSTEPAYVRLAAAPAGQVTATAWTGATGSERTIGHLYKRILVERAGIDALNISDADIAAFDSAFSAQVGVYIGQSEQSIQTPLDFLVGSGGGWYGPDGNGLWRLQRIIAPSGTPAVTFKKFGISEPAGVNDADIIALKPIFTSIDDGGIPFNSVTIEYDKNYYVQDRDSLAGAAIDQGKLSYLEKEYRNYTAKAPLVWDPEAETGKHPLSKSKTFQTAIRYVADAEDEGDRRRDIFSVTRRRYEVRAALNSQNVAALDLGTVVALKYPRWDLVNGKLFMITGLDIDLLSLTGDFTLWG